MAHSRYSNREIVQRGQQWYEQVIHTHIETGNTGKILVIDIETGRYELDNDHMAAVRRALAEHPDAALYSMRIGYPTLGKIGGSWGTERQ